MMLVWIGVRFDKRVLLLELTETEGTEGAEGLKGILVFLNVEGELALCSTVFPMRLLVPFADSAKQGLLRDFTAVIPLLAYARVGALVEDKQNCEGGVLSVALLRNAEMRTRCRGG